jgi:hypothetical protein
MSREKPVPKKGTEKPPVQTGEAREARRTRPSADLRNDDAEALSGCAKALGENGTRLPPTRGEATDLRTRPIILFASLAQCATLAAFRLTRCAGTTTGRASPRKDMAVPEFMGGAEYFLLLLFS